METVKENTSKVFNLTGESVFVLLCVLVGFLLRFALATKYQVINGDGVYYATLGKKLISGDFYGGISAYWSPLYSLLVGVSSLFFTELDAAGRFVSLAAGALLAVPAYLLVRNFYGRPAAYLSTILLVIHPSIFQASGWVMTETLFALIFTTTILIGSYALRAGKGIYFFVVGLLLGAAYLTKPEAIGFIGLFFVIAAGAKFFRRNLSARRLLAGYLLLLVGFAVFALPYIFFLHEKTGNWTISQKLVSNSVIDFEKGLLRLTDDGETTMRDRLFGDVYQKNAQPSPIASPDVSPAPPETSRKKFNFGQLASKAFNQLKKIIRHHLPEILPYSFILVALVGLFFRRWTRQRIGKEIYLFSFIACTFLGYALTVIELRYSFAIIPILLGWTAFGIVALSGYIAKTAGVLLKGNFKINSNWLQAFILVVLAFSLKPLFTAQFETEELHFVPFEEKQAGLWLKQYSDKPFLLMSSSAIPAFYAGANHIYVPDEELSVVLEYARRKGVDYLLVDERRLKNTPRTFPADPQNFPAELKLIYRDEQVPGFKVFIYQLQD